MAHFQPSILWRIHGKELLLYCMVKVWGLVASTLFQEEDKRATTNVQNGLVFFFFLFFLPIDPVDISDGTICPLAPDQLQEIREHIASGQMKKSNLCKGCLLSEGPRRIQRRSRDVDRATHCLHIDIAGPLPQSVAFYFLVGTLRLPGLPLLLDARLLKTRISLEVCSALEKTCLF